jgi:hypothetical protein
MITRLGFPSAGKLASSHDEPGCRHGARQRHDQHFGKKFVPKRLGSDSASAPCEHFVTVRLLIRNSHDFIGRRGTASKPVIARLDRAIQFSRAPTMECEALEYWATRSLGGARRRAAAGGDGWIRGAARRYRNRHAQTSANADGRSILRQKPIC